MKLFQTSLTKNESTPIQPPVIPTGISYVGKVQTTGGNGGQTGHIQGFSIVPELDRIFIAWTSGVSAFRLSDKAYLYRTPVTTDVTESGQHLTDCVYLDGMVYSANAISGVGIIVTPYTNKVYEWNWNDLSVNRAVESEFDWYAGGWGTDGTDLFCAYGSPAILDGQIQKVDKATLMKANTDKVIIPNLGGATEDFGYGMQSMNFFDDPRVLASADYTTSPYVSDGSNIKFIDLTQLTYDIYRQPNTPTTLYDYGVEIVGAKMYIIQKGGGSSDVNTDILEFDILY